MRDEIVINQASVGLLVRPAQAARESDLLLVVQGEDAGGGGQLVIRGRGVIEMGRAMKNDAAELPLPAGRKPLEFFKQMRGRCAHAEKIMRLFSRASWKKRGLEAHPLDFPVPNGPERLRRDRRGSAVAFPAGTRHPQHPPDKGGQAGADAG